jgi:predicted RNA-binding Zn-ribbon protein involved in translation (DUF1610 family)
MIRVICPACQSKLDAKDKLLGQTRNCPQCGNPVVIRPENRQPTLSQPPLPQSVQTDHGQASERTDDPAVPKIERLSRLNRYLICDRTKVLATWENDSRGWQIRGDHGFVSAARNADKLPSHGDFKLVELRMDHGKEHLRLQGVAVYQLARSWALQNLPRGDDAIAKSITGPKGLLREQKVAVHMHLRQHLMRELWGDAHEVLEYLGNADAHSPAAGPQSTTA